MRRLVDSLLFLLIAYTVTWPLVRGFVTHPAARSDLLIEVHGDNTPGATLLVAADANAAERQEWTTSIATSSENGAALLPGLGDHTRVWVAIQRGTRISPVRAFDIDRSMRPPRAIVELPFEAESGSQSGAK